MERESTLPASQETFREFFSDEEPEISQRTTAADISAELDLIESSAA
jgi:hypothetical protein